MGERSQKIPEATVHLLLKTMLFWGVRKSVRDGLRATFWDDSKDHIKLMEEAKELEAEQKLDKRHARTKNTNVEVEPQAQATVVGSGDDGTSQQGCHTFNDSMNTWIKEIKGLNVQTKAAKSNHEANGNHMNIPQNNQNQNQGHTNNRTGWKARLSTT